MNITLDSIKQIFKKRSNQKGSTPLEIELFYPVRDWLIIFAVQMFILCVVIGFGLYLFWKSNSITADPSSAEARAHIDREALTEILTHFAVLAEEFTTTPELPEGLVDPAR